MSIKNLSPHYKTIPFVSPFTGLTCTKYTLQIFAWVGLKTSSPITPHFTITKDNVENSIGNDKVNVSRLVRDFIDFTPQTTSGVTQLLDGNNQAWVKTQVFYTTTDSSELTLPQSIELDIMSKGFSGGFDGENAQLPTNKVLIPVNIYKVDKNLGRFVVPILLDEKATTLDAVNDTLNIFFQDTVLDVLANDNLGFQPTNIITASIGSTPVTTGTVSIVNNQILFSKGSVFNAFFAVSYTIQDSTGNTQSAIASVTVSAVPSGVTAVDDFYLVNDTDIVNLTVQDNDVDGTPLTTKLFRLKITAQMFRLNLH